MLRRLNAHYVYGNRKSVCACLYIGIPRSYGGDPSRADRACAHKFRHEFRCARTNSLGRFFTAHQFTDPAVLLLKPVPRTRCASHGPGRYSRHSRSHPLRVPRLRPVSTAHPFTHRFAVARPAASGPAFTALLYDSRSHPLCVARGLGRFSHRYTVGTLERGEREKRKALQHPSTHGGECETTFFGSRGASRANPPG